ncbi:hypothetical protein RHSIM_Rhsim11G0116200 [Rhododendron simsii]|uniref:NAC domain-containing protein n=1 Tax=Rhododendron simsii TaxID=118357 RepID=A0A834LAM1_RHOSS|nr:hypothetical protein RHSIM_Rhsim11G0116200 [Rhododendron simsii]
MLNKKRHVIGYKRMLRFRIKNGSGAMDESGEGGHWIMHEFSLYGGNGTSTRNNQSPKGSEYVLCRIKKKRYDSKDTKKSPKRVKNVEVPKPAKRARTEKFEQEQKVEAPETENTVPYSQELLEAEKEGHYSQMLSDVDVDLEELHPMLESEQLAKEFSEVEEQGNYSQMLFDMDADLDFDALDPQALYGLAQTPFLEELSEAEKQGNYSQMLSSMSDEDLHEELVSILESEQLPSSINLDFVLPPTVPTPFFEEFSDAEEQGKYLQMLSNVDADIKEPVPILEYLEQLPSSIGLDFGLPPTVPTPFFEEFSEAEEQRNYSQMLSDVDVYTEVLVPILEYLEQLPSFGLDFDVLNEEWSL